MACVFVAHASENFLQGSVVARGVPGYNRHECEDGLLLAVSDREGGAAVVRHSSNAANTLFVEGTLVALSNISKETPLTVNLNLCAYKIEPPVCVAAGSADTEQVGGFCSLAPAQQQAQLHLADAPVRVEAYAHGLHVESSVPHVRVAERPGLGMATFAAQRIEKDSVIFDCHGVALPFPTVYTLCLSATTHLLFQCDAQCLAHSCDPNAAIVVADDLQSFRVVALRDINEGEVISFHYLSTEYAMNEPFDCCCGSPKCFGRVQGAKFVEDTAKLHAISHLFTPYIREQLTAQRH